MGGLNTGLLSDIAGQNRVAPEVGNPLGSYEQVLAVKQAQQNLQQNAALAPLRQQALQTQAQQQQLQIESQKMDLQSRRAYLDAVTQADGDPDKLATALAAAPLTPEHRAIADKNIAETRESLAKASQDQIAASQATKKQIAQALYGVATAPQEQQLPAWQAAVDQTIAMDPVTKKPYLPPGTLNRDAVPDVETVKTLGRLASLGGWQEAEANAIKAKREAAQASLEDLNTQNAQLAVDARKLAGAARLGPTALKAQMDSLPLERQGPFVGMTDPNDILRVALKPEDALKLPAARTAAQWGDYVNSVIDPAKYPALNGMLSKQVQFAMQAGGTAAQEEASKAVDKAVANVAEIEKEKDPVLRQQKLDAAVKQATTIAAAEAPIRERQAAATAALRQPYEAVNQMRPQVAKSAQDLAQARSVSDTLGSLIDLAKSGNKAAAADVQVAAQQALNAFQGIRRNNQSQIENTPGSLLDKFEGALGKAASGEPITPEIMDQIKSAQDALEQGAQSKHEQSIAAINSTLPKGATPFTATPPRLPDGGGKVIDKATAKRFYDAAGGDPKKAQKLAESKHWKVQ